MKKTTLALSALALSLGLALSPLSATAAETSSATTAQQMPSLAPMLEKVMPSVVSINVEGSTTVNTPRMPRNFQQFFGDDSPFCQEGSPFQSSPFCQGGQGGNGGGQQQKFMALGSGVIIDADKGYVVTNNHVVDNATVIKVQLSDGRKFDAKMVGKDPRSDIALIQIQNPKNLTAIKMADSDALRVGDYTVAIGNPFGLGETVTSGIVSALGRSGLNAENYENFIQTDAAINPGNSGGALLNMQGELIGINSAKAAATEVEGMGYAIPVSVAQPILDELMNRETRYKADEDHAGYIGVTCLNVDSTSAQTYGIPLGAFVDSVEEGGPAQTAGIQKGDVIVKFDGMTVSGSSDLVGKLEYYQAGETVEVVISRAQNGEYQEQTVSVTLGKKSEMKQADPQQGK